MDRRTVGLALFLALAFAGTSTAPNSASGLELAWSDGSHDIGMTASGPCTLLVRATQAAELLPQIWQLSWSAAGNDSLPLRIRPVRLQSGIADVCSITASVAPAASASRTDTAFFCSSPGARATIARYLIEIDAQAVARLKVIPIGDEAASQDRSMLEVTVNGGVGLSYPPLPLALRSSQVADEWSVTVSGVDLDRVRSVRYGVGDHFEALQLLSRSAELVTARGTLGSAARGAFLELVDDQGFTGAIEIPEEMSPEPWTRDRFLVRFLGGQVEPEAGLTGGLAAQLQFRSRTLRDSLVAVGVDRLERLLPWFKHSDVNSFNQLGEPVLLQDLADLYVAHVPPGSDIRAITRRLGHLRGIRYACPNYYLQLATPPPNDQYFGDQWWLSNTGQQPCSHPGFPNRDIDALHAWDNATGTENIRVGIIDTGILANHPDLSPRVVLDTSFIDSSHGSDNSPIRHGTAVAGIVAASTGNTEGVAGVARGVTLWSIKVGVSNPTVETIISGIDEARVKGLPIINMSLGSDLQSCSPGQNCAESIAPLNDACLQAYLSGMFLVAAAGNAVVHPNGTEDLHQVWPAAYHRRVFAVGAFLNDGQRWNDNVIAHNFCLNPANDCRCSNYTDGDPWLDVVAPGGRFIVTTRDTAASSRYYLLSANCGPNDLNNSGFSGTSAATPVVSGIAALLKSRSFDLTGDDLEQILIRTTEAPVGGYQYPVGYGRVRAGAALEKVVAPYVVLRDSLRASAQQLLVADSTVLYNRRFIQLIPGPDEAWDYTTSCVRYRLRGAMRFNPSFTSLPWAWIRGSGTTGWRDTVIYDYGYEVPGGRVVSITSDSVVFETNVYRIRDNQDTTITVGWFPGTPAQARIGCTALGLRGTVAVTGPAAQEAPFAFEVRPNPARREAWVDMSLPRAGFVGLEVFDLAGRRVATLVQSPLPSGRHRVRWDGRGAGAGVYYLRCGFGGVEIVRRVVLLGAAR